MENAENQDQRIAIPEAQKQQVLTQQHRLMKLPGMDRFYEYIKQRYSNVTRAEVRAIVSNNPVLQRHRQVSKKKSSRVIIAERPNQHWQIDLTEYMLPQHGFIIMMIDIYSRKIWARFIRTKEARKIAQFLNNVFAQEHPRILQSDNGTEFKNNIVLEACQQHEVKQVYSSTYLPTSNAYVERANRTIKSTLEKLKTAHMPANLAQVVAVYNNTWHRSIKTTPNLLHNGAINEEDEEKIINRKIANANKITAGNSDTLEEGDIVRVALQKDEDRKLNKDIFEKGYTLKWSAETFVIDRVIQPRSRHGQLRPIPYYYLAGKGQRIYYRQDLLKIPG